MLTEIEWWGGVLIIWGVMACRSMARLRDGNTRWFSALALCTYGFMGVAFALYFYELQQPLLRQLFLATAGVAGLCLLAFVLFFFRHLDDGDDPVEEDEGGMLLSLVASALMLTPLLVPFALIGFKSWTVLQLL